MAGALDDRQALRLIGQSEELSAMTDRYHVVSGAVHDQERLADVADAPIPLKKAGSGNWHKGASLIHSGR